MELYTFYSERQLIDEACDEALKTRDYRERVKPLMRQHRWNMRPVKDVTPMKTATCEAYHVYGKRGGADAVTGDD